jgi:hypothetical protein
VAASNVEVPLDFPQEPVAPAPAAPVASVNIAGKPEAVSAAERDKVPADKRVKSVEKHANGCTVINY